MERLALRVAPCKTRTKPSPTRRGPRCPYSRIADKYGLRPRTIIRRLLHDRRSRETPQRPLGKRFKPHGTAKHRRRLVIAREQCQEQEIDQAFENLRQALPDTEDCCRGDASAETKMTTLKMALRYIDALSRLLQEDENTPDAESPYGELHSPIDSPTPHDDHEPFPASPNTPEDTKDVPAEDEDPPEESYILALAKIFDESDDGVDTCATLKTDPPCASDGDDVSSSRDDFSDLSDHDLEGQLDALANLGRLSGGKALLLS